MLALLAAGAGALLGVCGPFFDVFDAGFCPYVVEIFYLGITTGTTPTTYDPASSVSRLQMAAFLSRTVDRSLQRSSRRAALGRFWTPQTAEALGLTTVGAGPVLSVWDGKDIWVGGYGSGNVSRVRASDGKVLGTWTGATGAAGALVALGRIVVAGSAIPGRLYLIDPREPAVAVTTVASNLGDFATAIAFDGDRVWTSNFGPPGSVSIAVPSLTIPWTVTTIGAGFVAPLGMLYDGANVWITDNGAGSLVKLGANGAILQTVTVGSSPYHPVFDGANIWVPNFGSDSVSVVRASSGTVLATLTGNGLSGALGAAFDGQRVLVTNYVGHSVSLWKAAGFTPLGFFPTGPNTRPSGVCADRVNFWISLSNTSQLARF